MENDCSIWEPDSRFIHMFLKDFHLREWKKSKIDPFTINYNLQSLAGDSPYDFLFHNLPDSERRNTGQLRSYWLNNYAHVEAGGWW